MVKRTFLLGAAFIAVSACNPKAPDTTAKSADTTSMATTDSAGDANLRAAALKWFELYNKQDADGVASLYADDAVIMAPGASAAAGKEAIRTFLAGDIAGAKKAGVSDTGEISGSGISGDMAWVTGTFSIKDAAGKQVDAGKFVSVYKRTNGEWKIIRDIGNSDNPSAPAPPPKA